MIRAITDPLIKRTLALWGLAERASRRQFLLRGKYLPFLTRLQLSELFVPQGYAGDYSLLLNQIRQKPDVHYVSSGVMQKLQKRNLSDELLAVVNFPAADLAMESQADTTVVLDGVNNEENIGMIARSCLAFGVYSMIVIGKTPAEIFTPRAIQASTGSLLRMNCISMGIEEFYTYQQGSDKKVVVASSSEGQVLDCVDLVEYNYLVVGNETTGVSDKLMKIADTKAQIPISANVDSLNVSSATSVLLYELARQKRSLEGNHIHKEHNLYLRK